MGELTYRAAVTRALTEELARDPRVAMLGEDIGSAGGVFKTTDGLSPSSASAGSGTPRFPSRRSSGPRSAPRWRACGRSPS